MTTVTCHGGSGAVGESHGGRVGKHWGQRAAGDCGALSPWAVALYPGHQWGERVSREGAGACRAQHGPLFPAALGLDPGGGWGLGSVRPAARPSVL